MTLIDCDVHPAVASFAALVPYMDSYWRDQVVSRGLQRLDVSTYRPTIPLASRPDWRGKDGRAGTILERVQAELLDAFSVDLAICNVINAGSSIFNPYLGQAVCRATNDWLAREWLDKDSRLRGSILVPIQEPSLAVEEIERVAGDRRFVQVLLPAAAEMPFGRRVYWPIYAAAAKHGLPVAIHPGGGGRYPQSYTGTHTSYAEDYYLQANVLKGQLMSILYEGVFTEYPDLKLVLLESGVTWLPNFLTDADNKWKALRREVPWITEAPSKIVRRNVRLTVQPFDAPDQPEIFEKIVTMLGSDEMLLFSSDYPHWQFDGDNPFPAGVAASRRADIADANPRATYPRLTEDRHERPN